MIRKHLTPGRINGIISLFVSYSNILISAKLPTTISKLQLLMLKNTRESTTTDNSDSGNVI